MLSTSSFSRVDGTVISMLWQAIIDCVVVRGVGDEDVDASLQASRRLQRTRHDSHGRRILKTPKYAGAAALAKPTFGFRR